MKWTTLQCHHQTCGTKILTKTYLKSSKNCTIFFNTYVKTNKTVYMYISWNKSKIGGICVTLAAWRTSLHVPFTDIPLCLRCLHLSISFKKYFWLQHILNMKHHHNIQKKQFSFSIIAILWHINAKYLIIIVMLQFETNILQLKNIKWNVLQELQVLNLTLQLFIDWDKRKHV